MDSPTPTNHRFAGNGADHNGLRRVGSNMHSAVDHLAGAANVAVGKVKPVIGRAAEIAHQLVDQATDVAAPTAAWLNQKSASLAVTRRKVTGAANQYVTAHPWKSIGIGLAFGLLVGTVIGKSAPPTRSERTPVDAS